MQSRNSWYLPNELWSKVLRFSTLEDNFHDDDELSLLLLHPPSTRQQSLCNKRSVASVCKKWRRLAIEYLWESVGNFNQDQLVELAEFLREDAMRASSYRVGSKCLADPQASPNDVTWLAFGGSGVPRGYWIRSLVTRFDFGDDLNVFATAMASIFSFCPNLRSFIHVHDHHGPLPTAVITSLAEYCGRTLVRFQLDWGGVNIDDLIHLLNQSRSLQHIALGCTYDPPSCYLLPPETQEAHKRIFHFEKLRYLQFGNSEDGMIRRFNSHLLEASAWIVPCLTAVSIDLDARTCVEEVTGFLQAHGEKLKALSLTDAGRLEGIPIGWTEILSLCPNIRELRVTFNPFSNFNVREFTLGMQPGDQDGDDGDALEEEAVSANGNTVELPQFVTSPMAAHLQRLCFDNWDFFPDFDHILNEENPSWPLETEEDFLANVIASPAEASTIAPTSSLTEGKVKREYLERVMRIYLRVLDNVFDGVGGEFTPSLRTVQFDFHAGHIVLPDSCKGWWDGWITEWKSRGLRLEGCDRIPL